MMEVPLYEASIKQLINFGNSQCDIGESLETLEELRYKWDIDPTIPDEEIGKHLYEWCERNEINPTYFIGDTYVDDHRVKERRREEEGVDYQVVELPGLGTCRVYASLDRIVYLEYSYEYYFGNALPVDEVSLADELEEGNPTGDELPSSETPKERMPSGIMVSQQNPNMCLYWKRIRVRDISLSEYKALVNGIG